MTLRRLFFLFSLVTVISFAFGQGTVADYKRALTLDTLYRGKVDHAPIDFHWMKAADYAWYIDQAKGKDQYLMINASAGTQSPLFDHSQLAVALEKFFHKSFNQDQLKLHDLTIEEPGKTISFRIDSAFVNCNLSEYSLSFNRVDEKAGKPRDWGYWGNSRDELGNESVLSPDKQWKAKIEDYNVMVEHIATKKKTQLSYDGTAGSFYSSYLEWSPDSKYIATSRVVPGEKNYIRFVESSPAHQLQPVLQEREYNKPGDALSQYYPQLFDVTAGKHIAVKTDAIPDQYGVYGIRWRGDSQYFTFEYNQRGHQVFDVMKVDLQGQLSPIIHETSKTFIDYSGKNYRYDLEETHEIIWASERSGWNHLYLYDSKTGKVKNAITKGEWVVRQVVKVDEKGREIILAASGMDAAQDPYQVHYLRVSLDGKKMTRLTTEDGNHQAWFSESGEYFVDQYSKINVPPVTLLRNGKTGQVISTLQKADISRLTKTGWKAPEIFTAKARDGKADIWGIVIRPSNFDPNKTYPVLEYIYAGPHSAFVPKSFRPYLWSMHAMAELGFVVVQLDGMGTSLRSKAFHDICYQNLKDGGFPDRKLWIKTLATKYPYINADKVGIYGTSAGGQNSAAAVVFHSDFYDVAVSSCGCHDNRMDKIWWNEQFMGKIGPHYAACSNTVNAAQMGGKLMLIVGEVDDNVDPATTLQFADALIKARKDFELVVIPGMGHSSGGDFGERKRKDYFVKHLLGVDPPAWSEVYE